MRVAQFVSETVGAHLTWIVESVSSVSDALELKFCSIVKVFRSAERCYTMSRPNLDTRDSLPDPSL